MVQSQKYQFTPAYIYIDSSSGLRQQAWNEVADELAAIGRNTAPPYNSPPAATSQLHDRVIAVRLQVIRVWGVVITCKYV